MKKLLVAIAVFWVATIAQAQVQLATFPPSATLIPGGGWVFKDTVTPAAGWFDGANFGAATGPRAWTNGVYGGVPKFVATDLVDLGGPAGRLGINLISGIGLRDAAIAVARCALGANLICAAGTAAYLAYEQYRIHKPDGGQYPDHGAGLLDFDPGQSTVSSDGFLCSDGGTYSASGSTNFQACSAMVKKRTASMSTTGPGATTWTGAVDSCSGSLGNCVFHEDSTGESTLHHTGLIGNISSQTVQACPASIDASNPAYDIPAGSPVGRDGKCPTARYNHQPYTPEQAAGQPVTYPPSLPSQQWGQAVGDAIDHGGQSAPANVTSSGPASQTGPGQTTTTTSGNSTTTTTNTPTYNYNYAGNTINYTTTTTNVTNNNGAVTTTTTTGPNAPPAQDPKDPCTANPGRAGCVSLGDAPAAEAMPTSSVPITYVPTMFAGSAACPAPVPLSFSISGVAKSFTISYQPLCDLMTILAPIFLALGAAGASIIFMQGLRT